MADEILILSGTQIATYASWNASWPAPTWQTTLTVSGISELGDSDSRFILVRTQGSGDTITNGQIFSIYEAVLDENGDVVLDEDGNALLLESNLVVGATYATPDAYENLAAGDDYMVLGLYNGEQIIISLNGFDGDTVSYSGENPDEEAGEDGELSIGEIEDADPDADDTGTICFTGDAMIRTTKGEIPCRDLRVGMRVLTKDRGPQPIRWIGKMRIGALRMRHADNLRPVRIKAGAIGTNLPSRDLLLSQQHRILLRSPIVKRMFSEAEVLVAAKFLLDMEGVEIAADTRHVVYYHLLFDRHEVIWANGLEAESLFVGPMAVNALSPAALAEIFEIFPQLRDAVATPEGARPFITRRRYRRLSFRHKKNSKPLIYRRRRKRR